MNENIDLSKNIELNEALAEFETRDATSVIEKKEAVPVLTATPKNYQAEEEAKTSKMALWVMKVSGGLIKKPRQAERVLLIFALIIFLVSLFLFLGGNKMFIKNETKGSELLTSPLQ